MLNRFESYQIICYLVGSNVAQWDRGNLSTEIPGVQRMDLGSPFG